MVLPVGSPHIAMLEGKKNDRPHHLDRKRSGALVGILRSIPDASQYLVLPAI